jgi:hypothetical protein
MSTSPLYQPVAPMSESDKLVRTVTYIAGGAVALLVVAIITTALVNRFSRPAEPENEIAAAPRAAAPVVKQPSSAPKTTPAPSSAPSSGPVPPPPPSGTLPAPTAAATNSESTPSTITGLASPASPDAVAAARLPDGVQSWYEQPGTRLTGLRRAGPSLTPATHFSWMTGLLPFLGHGKVYERLDFNQPPTQAVNMQVGMVLIPEFLNPLDDHQRWKGYPFNGIALTHFAGMSGVEDARNVVAAQLPRSDSRAGVFGYDEVARPEQITDGTSQTIMIVGAGEMSNPWLLGGGGTIRGARQPLFDKTSGLGTKGIAGGGSVVVMADGSVRHVTANVDPRVFQAMCTIHGAESIDLPQVARPFAMDNLKGSKLAETPYADQRTPSGGNRP